jgi:hypothetical protein
MIRRLAVVLCVCLLAAAAAGWAQDGGSRAELEIPEEVWRDALAAIQQPGPGLGYSGDVMRNYKYDTHLLRTVEVLFADVRAVPRYSGKISDELIAAAGDPAKLLWLGYVMTDISAGRDVPGPAKPGGEGPAEWGVDWLGADAGADGAMRAALERIERFSGRGEGEGGVELPEAWAALPERARRLAARLTVAIAESVPYLARAYGPDWKRYAEGGPGALEFERVYAMLVGPWVDERLGQFVTPHEDSFALLRTFDRHYAAFGAVLFARLAWVGIQEFLESPGEEGEAAAFERLVIATGLGEIIIQGGGDDLLEADGPLLVVDLGGNDTYLGRFAASTPGRSPIGVLVDLAGDDTYGDAGQAASFGAGILGLGALFDLGGNDRYTVQRSGLGAAHFGTGLLYDKTGDDTYEVRDRFGQGAGIAGVGMLVDLEGNDTYTCAQLSQGMGGTLGAGVLLDLEGDDRYIARDDGNISELYLNRSVAMSQGCGWGRRADFGDGHTLAGGVGVLVDGAGDDLYSAQVWAQGCGYWWGLGILEDRSGNDTYRNGKYSAGSAAHFAIGICVDLAGDDVHNQDNEESSMNQYQGHARDGSIGIFIDGDGNDRYIFREHCGGSADLGSLGLFWDRRGDDVYTFTPWQEPGLPRNGWNYTPPIGTSTWYPPMRTFRDDLITVGIFLDTGGRDVYEGPDEREGEARPRNDGSWTMFQPWASWGVGIDREVYP